MPHQLDAYKYEITVSFLLAVPQGQGEPPVRNRKTHELIRHRLQQTIGRYAQENKLVCLVEELDVTRVIAHGDSDWKRTDSP